MKKLVIFTLLSILAVHVFPCTMFRLTVNGKTLVGNNEDFSYPFSRMWAVPAENGKYGVLYFGFDNGFPQGGMNEKGLVFDGFSMPQRKVKNIEGKEKINGRELFYRVMSECATVEEVEALVNQLDLSFLSNAQLMFADANGHSMILEGDDILKSEGPYQGMGVVRSRPRYAGCDHIAIADSLDLFETVALDQPVELGEHRIEQLDHFLRAHHRCHGSEADQISEQDAGIGDAVCNDAVLGLQNPGDFLRQNVEKQVLGTLLFGTQQAESAACANVNVAARCAPKNAYVKATNAVNGAAITRVTHQITRRVRVSSSSAGSLPIREASAIQRAIRVSGLKKPGPLRRQPSSSRRLPSETHTPLSLHDKAVLS